VSDDPICGLKGTDPGVTVIVHWNLQVRMRKTGIGGRDSNRIPARYKSGVLQLNRHVRSIKGW
jgi:hypothetical protein